MKILIPIVIALLLELKVEITSQSDEQTVHKFKLFAPLLSNFLEKSQDHAIFAELARECEDVTVFVRQLESFNLILTALTYIERTDMADVIKDKLSTISVDSIAPYTIQGMQMFLRRISSVPLSSLSISHTTRALTSFLRYHIPPPTDGFLRLFLGLNRGVMLSKSCFRVFIRVVLNNSFFELYLNGIKTIIKNPENTPLLRKISDDNVDDIKSIEDREARIRHQRASLTEVIAKMTEYEIEIPEDEIERNILEQYELEVKKRVRDELATTMAIEPAQKYQLMAGALAASTLMITIVYFILFKTTN